MLWGALGTVLLGLAWSIPSYLRAISSQVLWASRGEPQLISEASSLMSLRQAGMAEIMLHTLESMNDPEAPRLRANWETYAERFPEEVAQGVAGSPFDALPKDTMRSGDLVMDWLMDPTVRETLRQGVTWHDRILQTAIEIAGDAKSYEMFAPVGEPGGQALESVLLLVGLLHSQGHLTAGLIEEIKVASQGVNTASDEAGMEGLCVDIMVLARRLNWGQLIGVFDQLTNRRSLRMLATESTRSEQRLGIAVTALWLCQDDSTLSDYYQAYPARAFEYLAQAMRYGRPSLDLLLSRSLPVHKRGAYEQIGNWLTVGAVSDSLSQVAARHHVIAWCLRQILTALSLLALLNALFCLSLFQSRQQVASPRYHLHRKLILVLMGMIICLSFTEPFLAQDVEKEQNSPTWKFPMVVSPGVDFPDPTMDTQVTQITLLALAVFFLLQVGIYALCLVKIREIKRQQISSNLKLKLLDNEDNMFDAGLYVGLAGTVLSLVCLALGIIKPGLMSAYASTLFGILFVSILKILHVRPYRRQLILEEALAEA